jgi:hypothetical protein
VNKVDTVELTVEEERRRTELIRKLKLGDITLEEAEELKGLLE